MYIIMVTCVSIYLSFMCQLPIIVYTSIMYVCLCMYICMYVLFTYHICLYVCMHLLLMIFFNSLLWLLQGQILVWTLNQFISILLLTTVRDSFDFLLLSVSLLPSFALGQHHESSVLLFIIYHRTQLELNEVNWCWSSLCSWTLQSEMMGKLRIVSDTEQRGGLKEERKEYRIQGLNFSVLFLLPRLYFQIQTTQAFWGIFTCSGHQVQSILKEVVGIFYSGASKNCIWTKRLAEGGGQTRPQGNNAEEWTQTGFHFLIFLLE